jgi:hypothetical protein
MSQNMMVSWRRSGDADWARARAAGSDFGAATILASRLAPHSGQNFALGGLSLPQAGHLRDSAEPHSAQNLADCGTGALQFGHSTSVPQTNGLHTLAQSCRAKYADESLINLSSSAFGQRDWDSRSPNDGRNWHKAGVFGGAAPLVRSLGVSRHELVWASARQVLGTCPRARALAVLAAVT